MLLVPFACDENVATTKTLLAPVSGM